MNKSNIVIFLGPPGSGKGSLSKLCIKRLGWIQLSTGNLCREHIFNKSEIGKKIDLIIKSGKLISDDIVIEMVEGWLLSNIKENKSIILDGFPRTIEQAKALHKILDKNNILNINVVKLETQDEDLISRLRNRAVCSNTKCQATYSLINKDLRPKVEDICDECSSKLIKRADDSDNTVMQRLKTYRNVENDIVQYFLSYGKSVKNLHMNKSIELIYQEFLDKLNLV